MSSSCSITFIAFPGSFWLKPSHFSPFSLSCHISVNIYLKSKEHWKILKTTCGSSPRTDLSNNITFIWYQSHATVPLRIQMWLKFSLWELSLKKAEEIRARPRKLESPHPPVKISRPMASQPAGWQSDGQIGRLTKWTWNSSPLTSTRSPSPTKGLNFFHSQNAGTLIAVSMLLSLSWPFFLLIIGNGRAACLNHSAVSRYKYDYDAVCIV